jgi:hypothetical protein
MPTAATHREKMLGHVARWKAGSLTKRAYCQRSGIDYNQFHYWFRVSNGLMGKDSDPKPVFLPIRVEAVHSTATAIQKITVTGPSGLVARFPVSDEAIVLIRPLLNG